MGKGLSARHPVLSTVAVLMVVGMAVSVVEDDEPSPTPAASDTRERDMTADEVPEQAPRRDAEDTTGSDEPAEAGRRARDGVTRSAAGAGSTARPAARPAAPTFLVTRVVDGDTVELGNGETVRLVGIDTPEVGECAFEGAATALERIVLGKRVRLTVSDEDRDSYGRLLRYVDVGRTDAGLRLIEEGLAIARYDSRDGYGFHPRQPVYVTSDRGVTNVCPMATGRPAPRPEPEPAPARPRPLVGASTSCAAGYAPCVPPGPGDLDCPDVDGPIRVTGSDPHGLDADGDGVACES